MRKRTWTCGNANLNYGLFHLDEAAQVPAIAEFDDAGDFREERVVFAKADIQAGLKAGAALPHDDGTAGNELAAEDFNAEPLGVGIAAVFGTT